MIIWANACDMCVCVGENVYTRHCVCLYCLLLLWSLNTVLEQLLLAFFGLCVIRLRHQVSK